MGLHKITAGFLPGFLLGVFTVLPGMQSMAAAPATPPASSNVAAAKYANALHLAYIRTGNPSINNESNKGMEALAVEMSERTSINPAGVVGLDIEQDDISLFPFIYWPVTSGPAQLSVKAQKKVQDYLSAGGFILFDMNGTGGAAANQKTLRHMLGDVSLKPLAPMNKDHLLTKTFYIVSHLRGSFDYETILVESGKDDGTENVSSVVIGENNWAGAWAATTLPSGSRERQMALRAGINLVMYALTGNYKADQARILKTLDKLDKK